MRFDNKVAVVTGAARGIGKACAARLLSEGARVVVADIDALALETTAASLGPPDQVLATVTDVSRKEQVDALVAAAVAAFGGVDIMVNNAGIAMMQDFLDITEADYEAVLAVNLKGPFLGVQAAGRQMIAQGRGGVIINMSSINSRLSNPRVTTYAISKGGLNQLTGTASIALAPYGIRVCGVGPGTIM
ncbi:MAG TPA: SDR family NAD(P)-dependent oxidoreductase, partial [Ilumatobacteraceae bacterium]